MARSLACTFFFDAEPLGETGRHVLDACVLCSKLLRHDSDIFMYRGDTPFCSEECRYEQMHLDAACARQAASVRQKQHAQWSRHEATAAPVSRKTGVSVASY
ncbi:hypothetical protein E2562_024772 [Oryza meyeriana var. granulata]|uniref:FLZ-type domain-containing protein n=1 Tax=Oryza meyeriana var. granulata TaxID=110450 RepID=A0A6G1E147_9ORYZ|nr:hypothetical protein E2562_024772 [Oryza meyeriana var. granulata]